MQVRSLTLALSPSLSLLFSCVCAGFLGGLFLPSFRSAVLERFSGHSVGSVVDISNLNIGPPPKHLAGKQRLVLTQQLIKLHYSINDYFLRPMLSVPSSRSPSSVADLNECMRALSLGSDSAARLWTQLYAPLATPAKPTSTPPAAPVQSSSDKHKDIPDVSTRSMGVVKKKEIEPVSCCLLQALFALTLFLYR